MTEHDANSSGVEPFTIVTAFFDIGRSDWSGFERTRNYYLDCFKFWARMRNKLIIYSDQETCERAMQVRKDFGLENQTKLEIIDDIFAIQPKTYERIKYTMSRPELLRFRLRPEKPEASVPEYNYLMHLKPYFVVDAINKNLTGDSVAWVDFGFNQNGVYYLNPEEFDFEWSCPLHDKFHLFARLKMDDRPIFEIIHTMGDSFQATVMPGPAKLWSTVWDAFNRHQNSLLSCGLADSDQTLLIMTYREMPELFQVHMMEHFQLQSMRMFGAGHLTVRKQKKHKRIKREAREQWQQGKHGEAIKSYIDYLATKLRNELE